MSKRIDELQEYFDEAILPDGPIKLSPGETILHPGKFVDCHLSFLKANPGKRLFLPYFERLEKFYLILNPN